MLLINIFVYFICLVFSDRRVTTDAIQYYDGICISKHQEAVDDVYPTEMSALGQIQLLDFDKMPVGTIVENNGKTLLITMIYMGTVPTIAMGPFRYIGTFRFDHMYWHWMEPLPEPFDLPISAELHIVFYKATYASLKEASKHSDSIAILAYNILEDTYDKGIGYDKIVKELAIVGEEPYMQAALRRDKLLPLQSYVSSSIQFYTTYKGSWDENLCTSDVIWVDILTRVAIYPEFLNELKQMRGLDNQTLISQWVKNNPPKGVVRQPAYGADGVWLTEGATGKFPNSVGVYIVFCITMCIQFINVAEMNLG